MSQAGVRYALIGGFALHAAGYTRATGDIDMLVNFADSEKVKGILCSMGYKILHEDENVLNSVAPWQLIGGIDIIWARRQYSLDMLERRVLTSEGVFVLGPEGIIGLKVQAIANDPGRRLGDSADIEWLLRAHFTVMDMALVREYFALFSMESELDDLLKRVGHA
ncbi:MAG: hypothetical protein HQL20_09335 [Candidatus Omnitrophica bacterium]|nr:hypothetical protein [Candidatus Omnitrophota bacterium]